VRFRRDRGCSRRALIVTCATGALLSLAFFAALGACNTGIFERPANAGVVICECTCGTSLMPDAGDVCIATCEAPFDLAQQVADQDGCTDAFDAYSTCLENEGTCTARSFDAPTCGAQEAALAKCEASASPGG